MFKDLGQKIKDFEKYASTQNHVFQNTIFDKKKTSLLGNCATSEPASYGAWAQGGIKGRMNETPGVAGSLRAANTLSKTCFQVGLSYSQVDFFVEKRPSRGSNF